SEDRSQQNQEYDLFGIHSSLPSHLRQVFPKTHHTRHAAERQARSSPISVKTAEPSCRRVPHWLHQCDRTAAAAFSVDLATDQGRLPRQLWPACRRSRRWRYLLRERVP